jgi:hypothetical protein
MGFAEKKLMIILTLTVRAAILYFVYLDISRKKILGLKQRQRKRLLLLHKIANCLAI